MAYETLTELPVMDPERYINERVNSKIELYYDLSKRQKYRYYLISTASLIVAAALPAIVVAKPEPFPLLPAILSVFLTILIGLEKLFLFREHWKNYDSAEESLRREKYLFLTRSGLYAGTTNDGIVEPLTDIQAFHLFAQRFEDMIHAERAETIEARTRVFDVNAVTTSGGSISR